MGAYILRRLLLIIPTLLGIMIINFALVQFVPGGPVEQVIAQLQGQGDVFEGFAGGGQDGGDLQNEEIVGISGGTVNTLELKVSLLNLSNSSKKNLASTSHHYSGF